jgi:Domain of unknown function (DUF4157)
MFAPKVAKSQTKAAQSPTSKLSPQRSTLGGHRLGHDPEDTETGLDERKATPGVSWDFSQIPLFPPERASRSQGSSPQPAIIQPKLAVGQANDPLEHEADRVADQVMRMPDPGLSNIGAPPQISRKCAACEEEDKKMLLMKQAGASGAVVGEAPRIIHDVLRSPGYPLDAATRAFFEPRFGHDFSAVRVHTGTRAAESAAAVNALAYTVGQDVVFADGRYAPTGTETRRLLAHELAHVVQQGRGAVPAMLARAHDPHQIGSSRTVSLGELHDILVKLLTALKRKTQLSVMGFKTIAVGLVEGTDEKGDAFQTLVYTASGNWGSLDLEAQAAALGITRWNVRARNEGRGVTGAPVDAEQLMIEGQDQADMTLLGMAVSREPCLDCAEAIRDEDVQTVFVDPAKYLPKRERRRKTKPSASLENARAEIEQAFGPQVVAPGQEATAGLGPKSSLWGAVNVLDMRELYQVLEEADHAGRMSTIQAKASKAEGVDNNRLLAPMDAILLKKENLKQSPEVLRQALASSLLMQRLALIPDDQRSYILNQLYPGLRLATPPKQTAPPQQREQSQNKTQPEKKEESPVEKARESNSFVGPMIKALAALGVTVGTINAVASTLLTIAGDIFTNVVLRVVVEGSKVHVREAIREVVETGVKNAGPKLRVLGEAGRQRLPDLVADELTHVIEDMTRSYRAVP